MYFLIMIFFCAFLSSCWRQESFYHKQLTECSKTKPTNKHRKAAVCGFNLKIQRIFKTGSLIKVNSSTKQVLSPVISPEIMEILSRPANKIAIKPLTQFYIPRNQKTFNWNCPSCCFGLPLWTMWNSHVDNNLKNAHWRIVHSQILYIKMK